MVQKYETHMAKLDAVTQITDDCTAMKNKMIKQIEELRQGTSIYPQAQIIKNEQSYRI